MEQFYLAVISLLTTLNKNNFLKNISKSGTVKKFKVIWSRKAFGQSTNR